MELQDNIGTTRHSQRLTRQLAHLVMAGWDRLDFLLSSLSQILEMFFTVGRGTMTEYIDINMSDVHT